MVLKFFSFFVFLLFIGCEETPYQKSYIDGDDLIPPEPSSLYFFTLHGLDADGDGVRDDVELWINERFIEKNNRKAAKSIAKLSAEMLKHVNVHGKFLKLFQELRAREYCLMFVNLDKIFTRTDMIKKELYDVIFNHPYRQWHYEKGFEGFPSGSIRFPDVKIHEYGLGCDFVIEDLRKIVDAYNKARPKEQIEHKTYESMKEMYENHPARDQSIDKFSIQNRNL